MNRLSVKVGLLGRDSENGLGYQNAAIARHLDVVRWIVPRRPLRYRAARVGSDAKRIVASEADSPRRLTKWVRDLDCLIFAEQPDLLGLIHAAARAGVAIACIPNWEHLAPDLPWIRQVDLMVCPTRATYQLLEDWRRRFGFEFALTLVPWPIDPDRYRFRRRDRCQQVLFVNGWGGCRARRLDGAWTEYRRKGLDTVIAAASLAPEIDFIVCSQLRLGRNLPSNIRVRGRFRDNRSLYDLGDVCLQPSYWEGIGLPLLECQASGLPLITTDAPPMNEYRPLAALPVSGQEPVLLSSHPFSAQFVDPAVVAENLRRFHGQSLSEASVEARQFVEQEHNWKSRRPQLLDAIERVVTATRGRHSSTPRPSTPTPEGAANAAASPAPPFIAGSLNPAAKQRRQVKPKHWSVGITTTCRTEPTLNRCLSSIVQAGWNSPRLFVDGDHLLPADCRSFAATTRDTAVGAWPNFYLGLAELFMRDPRADAYLMFQDDALICHCPQMRSYLESVLWPGGRPGVLSLYCSRAYTQPRPGWYRHRRLWQWGALAFVFSPVAVEKFLTDRYVVKHRQRRGTAGKKNVDGVVGRWARRRRIPIFYPTPSLVQHIGDSSTVWRKARATGDRQADRFAVGLEDLP